MCILNVFYKYLSKKSAYISNPLSTHFIYRMIEHFVFAQAVWLYRWFLIHNGKKEKKRFVSFFSTYLFIYLWIYNIPKWFRPKRKLFFVLFPCQLLILFLMFEPKSSLSYWMECNSLGLTIWVHPNLLLEEMFMFTIMPELNFIWKCGDTPYEN